MTANLGAARTNAAARPGSPSTPVASAAHEPARAANSVTPRATKKGMRTRSTTSGSAANATARMAGPDMGRLRGSAGQHGRGDRAVERGGGPLPVVDEPAFLQVQLPLRPLGGVRVVRHQDDGLVQVL